LTRKLRVYLQLAILGGFLFLLGMQVAANAQSCTGTQPTYYVASMDLTIDPGAQDFVMTSMGDSQASCANHFVLVMNTFGGDGRSMDNIIKAISNFEAGGGTVITLIAPSGTHAFSAGAYIAEASDLVYMIPGTTIGSATPIVYNIPTGEENTTLTKDINGFATYMQSLTLRNHRNATATALMVTRGVSYTADRAARLHVIDGVLNATSVAGALSQIGVP
jgi:membrane-bound serine protease (ClpP class)